MKIKNYIKKAYKDIKIRKDFYICLCEYVDPNDNKKKIGVSYYFDTDPLDSDIWYELDKIKLTGEETISQVKKIVKDYVSKNTISDTKVIKSCYDSFDYDEYSMTMKSTKNFVNALKKYFRVGNDFIYNDMGIYGLKECAMYLGY